MNKKKIIIIILIISTLVVFVTRPDSRIKKGDKLIQKIEMFKQENGRLPESLGELGYPFNEYDERGPLYYDRSVDGLNYLVSFGTTLGESTIYYSTTKKWVE